MPAFKKRNSRLLGRLAANLGDRRGSRAPTSPAALGYEAAVQTEGIGDGRFGSVALCQREGNHFFVKTIAFSTDAELEQLASRRKSEVKKLLKNRVTESEVVLEREKLVKES